MGARNTRQKQLILEVLKEAKMHPTIGEIYQKVNKIDPNIGQATVYRNVKRLATEGYIQKISPIDAIDCYDGNPLPHYHLICQKCGKLIDLYDEKNQELIQKMERKYQVKILNEQISFSGICKECLNEKVQM